MGYDIGRCDYVWSTLVSTRMIRELEGWSATSVVGAFVLAIALVVVIVMLVRVTFRR